MPSFSPQGAFCNRSSPVCSPGNIAESNRILQQSAFAYKSPAADILTLRLSDAPWGEGELLNIRLFSDLFSVTQETIWANTDK